MSKTYALPHWLRNPHPPETMDWWYFEQFVCAVCNDLGACFDDDGNRTVKGPDSDLHDELVAWQRKWGIR
jgi:hypothetical protein